MVLCHLLGTEFCSEGRYTVSTAQMSIATFGQSYHVLNLLESWSVKKPVYWRSFSPVHKTAAKYYI